MKFRLARILPEPVRRKTRRLLWEHPALYFPLGLVQFRRNVFGSDFDLWIDGYPRSGNTFAAKALQLALPEQTRIRSHLHHPAFILASVRARKPGIFVIRDPKDAALSWSLYTQRPVAKFIDYYADFHRALLPVRERLLVAPFEQITTDFGAVLARFAAASGLPCRPFAHTPESEKEIFAALEKDQVEKIGRINERTVWRPSPERSSLKADLVKTIDESPSIQAKLRAATSLYREFMPVAQP